MTPNEYQRITSQTICPQNLQRTLESHPISGQMFLHACIGMVAEAGELASEAQDLFWYEQPYDSKKVKKELGDLLWYVAEACTALGITMEDVMKRNVAKVKVRHGDKFNPEQGNRSNRDLEAEDGQINTEFLNDR